jgi:hypothetical protein
VHRGKPARGRPDAADTAPLRSPTSPLQHPHLQRSHDYDKMKMKMKVMMMMKLKLKMMITLKAMILQCVLSPSAPTSTPVEKPRVDHDNIKGHDFAVQRFEQTSLGFDTQLDSTPGLEITFSFQVAISRIWWQN